MADVFTTQRLAKVVERLDRPSSFLLDTFFPMVQTEDKGSEEIHFDIDESKPRITPFVHPTVAGKVVDNEGYRTESFRPAYAKDKRRFDPTMPLKRQIGEQIGGDMSPAQRYDAAVSVTLSNQLEMLTRREEVMASEALRLGQVTVAGEGYKTVVVNFGRDSTLTIALLTTARWGESGVSPLDNLESWCGRVSTKSGAACRDILMDPLAWALFKKDPQVVAQLDRAAYRGQDIVQVGPVVRGQGNDKYRYMGSIGDLDFYMGQDVYVDDAGNLQQILPDYTVMGAARGDANSGRGGLEGTRCYGTILDPKANWSAVRYFSKMWDEEDPAVRWMLLQSAPLVVPYRPNASFCATVR